MGYIVSFLLGVYVATFGLTSTAVVIDNAVKKAQIYMADASRTSPKH